MLTVWKHYKNHNYKIWLSDDDAWCAEVRPRRGPSIVGETAAAVCDMPSKTMAEEWVQNWVDERCRQLAYAF